MHITENFALLNILQALEKLSAASKDKKPPGGETAEAEEAAGKTAEAAVKNNEGANSARGAGKNYEYTRSLLERHERLVNNIKNGKK